MTDHPSLGLVQLDWRLRRDPRSLSYKIVDHFGVSKTLRTRTWSLSMQLDQGVIPGCTGWSATQIQLTTPRIWFGLNDQSALAWYYEAQRNDEWDGEDYEGSSVLGACQAGIKKGYLNAYYWATTLDEIRHGVSQYGPMQIGSRWMTGMMEPDSDFWVYPTGSEEGGHAYELGAYNEPGDYFWIYQTWGGLWGDRGKARIRAEDLGSLVLDGTGEAALPRKNFRPT